MNRRFLILLLVLLPIWSLAQPIVWTGQSDFLTIGDRVSILTDTTGNLTIGQVSSPAFQGRFKPSRQVIINVGFSDRIHWLRFSLDNPTTDNLLLEVAQAFLPITELYYQNDAGKTVRQTAGFRVPVDAKVRKHHYQVFPIPPGKRTYFVRFLAHSQPVPISIWEASAHEVKTYKQRLIYGFYVGFMFFVLLSNLFFFFSLRNRMYLLYAVVVLIYLSYAMAVLDGFVVYFIDNLDLTFWYITIPTIGVTVQTIYCLLFLEAKRYIPKVSRFVWGVVVYFATYAVLKYLLPMPVILAINTVNALLSFFLMGFVGVKAGQQGNRLGYYFALAYFIYFLLVLTEATYIQTGKPAYFAELSHVTLATLIESFILSFLLSKRFEWERADVEKAKAEAQEQLLAKTLENEQLLLSQNETLEQEVAQRTRDIEHKSTQLQQSLHELKTAQAQLIQREKMASLGELTAGIAHEIQNPLNFVNNFSEVSIELIDELRTELLAGRLTDAVTISHDLAENLQRISQNGNRASGIVRGMLEHARTGSGERQLTDLNSVADEYLRMAYRDLRAKDPSVTFVLHTHFEPNLAPVRVVAQDVARVMLNLYTNAFYALRDRQRQLGPDYQPTLWVSSERTPDAVLFRVKDNGTGIPHEVLNKVFQPFFTTKPTGQGVGLGLSLSYDIITKGLGGDIRINTEIGQYTEVLLTIPLL
ncbi:7TM-DISM domain-containing protein [Fibrella sp. WM1]|uniref:sensor histidine kinase n=1 Tax=Fibrella musci TaxID=3242485 RepID=UPI00351FF02F